MERAMDNKEQAIEKLQWHPAFYAGLQIELQEDSDNLIFENEHQLGTKPKQIDALIIKKQKDIPIKKNIGKIFRGHNIVEYKSPTDYLCIDDYYKGYAYAMFYKSDTQKVVKADIAHATTTENNTYATIFFILLQMYPQIMPILGTILFLQSFNHFLIHRLF